METRILNSGGLCRCVYDVALLLVCGSAYLALSVYVHISVRRLQLLPYFGYYLPSNIHFESVKYNLYVVTASRVPNT